MPTSMRALRSHKNSVLSEAFGNDLVLRLIFNYLESSKDLKSCRLVCKDWEKEATKALKIWNWTRRIFLRFELNNDDKKFEEFSSTFSADQTKWLISCFRIENHLPIIHFQKEDYRSVLLKKYGPGIKSLSLDMKDNFSYAELNKWLARVSESLQELRLLIRDHRTLDDDQKYKKVMAVHGKNNGNVNFMSKLTYLCLTSGLHESLLKRKLNVLEMLLMKLPNGKSIKICLRQWENIERTVALLQTSQQLKNLKVLHIKKMINGEMKFLTEAAGPSQDQLQLEYLALCANHAVNYNRYLLPLEIHDFLLTQLLNLQMLEWTTSGGSYFKFPERGFSILKKLRLVVEATSERDATSLTDEQNWQLTRRPILYDHFFSKLEELELGYYLPSLHEFQPLFLADQSPCTSLRKFRISYPNITMDNLRSITAIFPNIVSLRIGIYDELMDDFERKREFFNVLWRDPNFSTNIQELYFEFTLLEAPKRGKYELDSLFSGVAVEIIQQVSDNGNFLEFVEELQNGQGQGSILNFQHLKKLTITSPFLCHRSGHGFRFSNFSVFCLFTKLTNLKYLHVDEEIRDFSNAACNSLKKMGKNNSNGDPYPVELSEAQPSGMIRTEQIFRSTFCYKRTNETKGVNLIGFSSSNEQRIFWSDSDEEW